MIKVGIIGASGYTGAELLRLLAVHPSMKLVFATADSQANQPVTDLYPHLSGFSNLQLEKYDSLGNKLKEADLIFCALPHTQAMKSLPRLENKYIVDLGGDFRLDEGTEYSTWYKHEHSCPQELGKWQYGLTELFRDEVRKAKRVANPGCYPTASVLALAPLLKENLIEPPVTINALSGISGAGRVPGPAVHFSHAFEDVRAYKVGVHQHTPEIEMALAKLSGKEIKITFTPHLIPMVRGINVTCTARMISDSTQSQIFECLYEQYKAEKFIEVLNSKPSGTKEVRGSNRAVISAYADMRTGQAIVTCVIDNLVKGASGQAIQNANLMLGFEEDLGLSAQALYP